MAGRFAAHIAQFPVERPETAAEGGAEDLTVGFSGESVSAAFGTRNQRRQCGGGR